MLLYDDITSASALAEAKRVWESLKPEAISSHAKRRWPDGALSAAQRIIEYTKFNEGSGCAEWTRGCRRADGYANVYVAKCGRCGHRLSWELFVGSPDGLCVLHKCDNRKCINPYHLFLGTRSDNFKDMWAKGRNAKWRGEQCGFSKLTAEQVLAIRARYKPNSKTDSTVAIARDYNMSQQQIYSVVTRRDWRWLDPPPTP